jgi:hypothetical protein
VEGVFSEVRLNGVLRNSRFGGSQKLANFYGLRNPYRNTSETVMF